MKLEPMIGADSFKLGVSFNDPLWNQIGENVPFKRNFLQKNPALDFPSKGVIVYFDNDNYSAGIEILGESAIFNGFNLIGVPLNEIKIWLKPLGYDFTHENDSIDIPKLGLSLYISKNQGREIVSSLVIFNESYIENNDLEKIV